MLKWISERLMDVVTYPPTLIVDPDSPNFNLVRTMFGLLLIAFVIFLIANRSEIASLLRDLLSSCVRKLRK